MTYWITGFLIGSLVGGVNDFIISNRIIFFISSIVFYFFIWKTCNGLKSTAIFYIGFIWGAVNNAPIPEQNLLNIKIDNIYTHPLSLYSKEKIITLDGSLYRVKKDYYSSGQGSIRLYNLNGLFNSRTAKYFPDDYFGIFKEKNFLIQFSIWVRNTIKTNLSHLPNTISSWLSAMQLGEIGNLLYKQNKEFKNIGAVHLLVVSGLHISLLSILLYQIIVFPLVLLFSLLIISPKYFLSLKNVIIILSVILAIIYGILVDFTQPSQRAIIVFSVSQLSQIFTGKFPLILKLKFCFILQALLFPLAFINDSSYLSWVAYLLVLSFSNFGKTIKDKVSKIFTLQVLISLLIASKIGTLNILAIFTNILIIPVFPLIYFSGLFLAFSSLVSSWIIELNLVIQKTFLYLISCLSYISDLFPVLLVRITGSVQLLFFIVILLFLLNQLKTMSIRNE